MTKQRSKEARKKGHSGAPAKPPLSVLNLDFLAVDTDSLLLDQVTKAATDEGSSVAAGRALKQTYMCVEIADTGVGITKDQMMQLFHPFQQVSTSPIGRQLNVFFRIF
jgi:signal transduction histidine kinase